MKNTEKVKKPTAKTVEKMQTEIPSSPYIIDKQSGMAIPVTITSKVVFDKQRIKEDECVISSPYGEFVIKKSQIK